MPGERGNPSKKYPQISDTREINDKLRDLKFRLRLESISAVIGYLIEQESEKDEK